MAEAKKQNGSKPEKELMARNAFGVSRGRCRQSWPCRVTHVNSFRLVLTREKEASSARFAFRNTQLHMDQSLLFARWGLGVDFIWPSELGFELDYADSHGFHSQNRHIGEQAPCWQCEPRLSKRLQGACTAENTRGTGAQSADVNPSVPSPSWELQDPATKK